MALVRRLCAAMQVPVFRSGSSSVKHLVCLREYSDADHSTHEVDRITEFRNKYG